MWGGGWGGGGGAKHEMVETKSVSLVQLLSLSFSLSLMVLALSLLLLLHVKRKGVSVSFKILVITVRLERCRGLFSTTSEPSISRRLSHTFSLFLCCVRARDSGTPPMLSRLNLQSEDKKRFRKK